MDMDQLNIYVPKGMRSAIESAAKKAGLSRAKWLLMLAEREIKKVGAR
jgi:hypothetical protein